MLSDINPGLLTYCISDLNELQTDAVGHVTQTQDGSPKFAGSTGHGNASDTHTHTGGREYVSGFVRFVPGAEER